jgi:hypothetical protein
VRNWPPSGALSSAALSAKPSAPAVLAVPHADPPGGSVVVLVLLGSGLRQIGVAVELAAIAIVLSRVWKFEIWIPSARLKICD